ncbi:chemotaxis protein CheA [Candidatus Magnetominusculus xianensis]|uniref:histidine kinase n=1 Tax=Candidatus Magnetominusculus xianensis TaxID=1748249 RepID=A0ABR5SIK0_9BACT|nr:chemotaxis protein CheA [Candidatus Magnetominusculus xianensis]KWT84077.1 chemotaxis protein CheA [Candidatus Magnetominusculus xianensis]MBF0402370.1 chemotaxis protein CheA [Nitrospirota bacterium]
MSDEMDEIINDFLIETTEIVEDLSQKFVELENDKDNQDLVNGIFRSVHTIKGASGFLGFNQMVQLTHITESVLKKIKDGDIPLTPAVMDVILGSIDMVKVLLEHIKAKDGIEEDLTDILAMLQGVYEQAGAPAAAEPPPTLQAPPEQVVPAEEPAPDDAAAASSGPSIEELDALMEAQSNQMLKPVGEILVENGAVTTDEVEDALKIQTIIKESVDVGEVPKVGDILTATDKVSKEEVKKALTKQPQAEKEKPPQLEQTIRVDVERLDNVLNLVGELVLARNRLMKVVSNLELKYTDNADVAPLAELTAFINLITTDLQLAVMKTRMQPVRKVFNKFPRMVRDLARSLKKDVELNLSGEETELDKSIIEEIGDPLVHLVRNSVDHGIEMPEVREAEGKPRGGTVLLSAYQEGNNIVLSIEDDGKGIDVEMLKGKIVEKGLGTPDELERLSTKEILDYIFLPGFSTAKVVSDVSGRGVGMDVVKTNISKLNGTITIETEKGKGSKFLLRLPLTLAIIQALMVGVGTEVYAVPLASVVETVRIDQSNIKTIRGQETVILRNEIVPVHRLANKFFIPTASANGGNKMYLVVIVIGEKKFGMMVDKLFGQEEVVIKSIEGFSSSSEGIAGATITGDGKVVLILDPAVMFVGDLHN